MTRYRFKTEQEFKDSKSWNNKMGHPDGWANPMLRYLGQEIPNEYNEVIELGEEFYLDDWLFQPNNYVLLNNTNGIQYEIY